MQQRVAAAVAEVLAHRAGRVRADVEQRRRIRRAGGDDDGVFHRAGLFERPHHLRDRRLLLPDRVVDADDVLPLLVDDRVDRDGGLAGLAVADDQFALAAADRHHRVDRLEPGLHRLLDRRARRRRPARCARSATVCFAAIGPLPSIGCPSALTTRPTSSGTDRHRDDAAGALDDVAFLDLGVVAEQHRADAFLFQVQRDAEDAVRELEHLAGHRLFDAVDARDAVADRHDGADFGHVDVDGIAADLVADDLGDFFCFDVHLFPGRSAPPAPCYCPASINVCFIFCSCVVTLPS